MKEEREPMFHLQDGWYFQRTALGGVRIEKRESACEDAQVVAAVEVTADSWGSVVESVARTDDGEALAFRLLDRFWPTHHPECVPALLNLRERRCHPDCQAPRPKGSL